MLSFKILEKKIIAYLVCSIVPFLAISIFFADLIVSTLSIFFFIYLIKQNSFFFYKNIIFVITLFFYFLCLISSFLSDEILFSLKSSLPLIRIIIFIFLISYLIQNNKFFLDIFYNFLKFTFLVITIYGLFQYIYEYTNLESKDYYVSYVRLTLPFSDEQKIGSFLVRLYGLLLAVYSLKKNYKKSENIFLFFLSISVAVVIMLSGERSSFFLLILFFSICAILLNFKLKFKIAFFFSALLISILILSQNSNLSQRIIFDKNNQLKLTSNKEDLVIFTTQHTAHYLSGFKMFQDKPFIGQGPRMFRLLCNKESFQTTVQNKKGCSSHPHNTYVQLLAEIGIVGSFLFCLIFFHVVFLFFKHFILNISLKKHTLSNYQIIICGSVLLVVWPFAPSGNFFNNWILIIYAFPIGFYFNEFFKYSNYDNN